MQISERPINVALEELTAKIVYHTFEGFDINTLLVKFNESHKVLSTLDGSKNVTFVGNTYVPIELSKRTMINYGDFKHKLLLSLGLEPENTALLSTGVNMDELAVCEKAFEEIKVC